MISDPKLFSAFRGWVHQRWVDNCEEHNLYDLPRHTIEEYWHKNKWWLKHKYREEQRKSRIEQERQYHHGKTLNYRSGDSYLHS